MAVVVHVAHAMVGGGGWAEGGCGGGDEAGDMEHALVVEEAEQGAVGWSAKAGSARMRSQTLQIVEARTMPAGSSGRRRRRMTSRMVMGGGTLDIVVMPSESKRSVRLCIYIYRV